MQEVLALSLLAMRDDMQRLDHISSNLANATTPGYKREVVVGQATPVNGAVPFGSVVDALQAQGYAGGASGTVGVPSAVYVQTDAQPGTLKSTGQSLDLALAGQGYFEVQTATGLAYTRQGSFRVDARGRLVTGKGDPVMGQGGEIVLNNVTSPVIDSLGRVFDSQDTANRATNAVAGRFAAGQQSQGATPLAQLKVVQIDDTKNMRRLGDGLVACDTTPSQMKDADVQVRQGYLENSNVSPMQEMVQLIQTMRHFESMQKIATSYDDMTSAAVRKLGDLS